MTTTERPRSRRRPLVRFVTLAALVLLLLWLVDRLAPTVTETRAVMLAAASRLGLEVGTGSVRLTPTDGEAIVVHRTVRHGWRDPEIQERLDGAHAVTAASCPTFFGGTCDIDYDIAVPEGLAIEMSASSGDLEVRGVSAQAVRTTVSSGRTTLVDVEGGSRSDRVRGP